MRVDIRSAIYSDMPKLALIKLTARGEGENSARSDSETQYLTGFLDDRQPVFVMLIDREPAAFCAVREYTTRPFLGYAHIKDLYVSPERQGRGCGKKLLMHVLRAMRAAGYMHAVLETNEDNAGAQRFYERFGFERKPANGSAGYITYTIDF